MDHLLYNVIYTSWKTLETGPLFFGDTETVIKHNAFDNGCSDL